MGPVMPAFSSSEAKAGAAPHVTVAVCTRDRSASLRRLLGSLAELAVPDGLEWELVLVDNGSTDDTAAVVEGFGGILPLRYVRHPAPGLCNARNRAVAEARGRYICWTDDDTMVDRDWLAAYAEAFARHPDATFFGGRIIPFLDDETPAWIRREHRSWPLATLLVYRDPGEEVIPVGLRRGPMPWGANWACRRAAQLACPFDPGLGYAPSRPRTADETDVIDRMLRGGSTGWWVPRSKVTHFVPAARLTWDRIRLHHVMQGATDAYLMERSPDQNWLSDRRAAVLRMSRPGVRIRAVRHRASFLLWRLAGRYRRALHSLSRNGYFDGMAHYWRDTENRHRPHGGGA